MFNHLIKIISLGALVVLTACSSVDKLAEHNASSLMKKTDTFNKNELAIFTTKVKKANMGLKILDDKEYIEMMLDFDTEVEQKVKNREAFTACVNQSLNKDEYANLLQVGTEELVAENSENFSLWKDKIDFLIKATNKIYYDPNPVEFNVNNLSGSSALKLFAENDAKELSNIITNKDYAPLLRAIGLPRTQEDGSIQDTIDFQIAGTSLYLADAVDICLAKQK